jgi:ribosomal protein S18 acetylase RimI-like enzyme
LSFVIELFVGSRSDLIGLFAEADDSPGEISRYMDAGEVLVARMGERIVGHIQRVANGSHSEIKSLAVVEGERRCGIGTSLIRTALSAAWSAGTERVFIATATTDTENLRFYQHLGFRMHRVERDVFTVERGYVQKSVDGIPLRDRVWLSIDAPGSIGVPHRHPMLHNLGLRPAREPHILIRAAVPDDAPGIAEVYRQSAEHHSQLDPEQYLIPSFETVSARYGRCRPDRPSTGVAAITLVAEIGTEIVGFVDVRLEESSDAMLREPIHCTISEIAVRTRHRNKGIGTELLRAAEDWGRKHGAQSSVLEYHVANTNAKNFYVRRMGYRETSITALKRL